MRLDSRISNKILVENLDRADRKILIVDDQSFNIDAALIILSCAAGINTEQQCDVAFNGKEALRMVGQNMRMNMN